jgi:hypothetical protein
MGVYLVVWAQMPGLASSAVKVQIAHLRACLVWVLKFNKHRNTFVLFDKKFPILD